MPRILQSGFHGGEYSPLLEGRLDLPTVHNGCRLLRNAIPRSLGGAFQRPGFIRVGDAHTTEFPTYLLPFSFSASINYRIELGNLYARFWLSDRLCITQEPPALPENLRTFSIGGVGTAVRKDWLSKTVSIGSLTLAEAYALANASNAAPANVLPPRGLTGVTNVTGGVKYGTVVYKGICQRMEGFFVPAATGNYQFRGVNIRSAARLSFAAVERGDPATAPAVLTMGLNAGLTVATTQNTVATFALTAGKAYPIAFFLVQLSPTPGQFQFRVGAGAWQDFTTTNIRQAVVNDTAPPAPIVTGAESALGEVLRLTTPWTAEQARQVQTAHANDVVWIAHGSHWPRRLIRYDVEDWRIEKMPVIYPPLRDPNSNPLVTLQASATTGAVTLTAIGGRVFEAGDVDGYYEISHRRQLPFTERNLLTAGDSADVRIIGRWEVFTYGKWNGLLTLYKRRTGTGDIDIVRTWKSVDDFNAQSSGEVEGDQVLFLRFAGSGTAIDGVNPRATLTALDASIRGIVQITSVDSATVAHGTVIRALHSTDATTDWAEGAWSTRRGFPASVTLHEQHLYLAGTRSEPQKIWASAEGAFDNFERTTLEDSSFSFQIAATQSNPIHSLISQDALLVLTAGDEWIIDGMDSPSISPSHRRAKRRSGTGSEPIQPLLVGSVVLFVQLGGRILCEYVYDFQQNGFESVDLTELAEHLGGEIFTRITFAQNPHSLLFGVTEDGSLLSMTYKRKSGVVAWAKHTTPQGKFVDVCTTQGSNGIHEVWASIRRTINGVERCTIEKLDIEHWNKLQTGEKDLLCIADGAVLKTFAEPGLVVDGLSHLEGATVGILADGAVEPDQVVVDGAVTLAHTASKAVVGLVNAMEVQPMRLDVQMDTGSAVGRRFRIAEVDALLWQTGAGKYADSPEATAFKIPFRAVADPTGVGVPLFTGQMKLENQGTFTEATRFLLTNNSMLPLNVLALVTQTQVYGE